MSFPFLLPNKGFSLLHHLDSPSSLLSTPSRRYGDRQLGAGSLKMRAGLFCVFPYLDVRSLLRAAEVCSDWRFVARHPAVWTRVRLEDSRVSADVRTHGVSKPRPFLCLLFHHFEEYNVIFKAVFFHQKTV